MKLVVQRVSSASVVSDGVLTGSINTGFLVLLGIHKDDSLELIPKYVKKLINLRIFEDSAGKLNLSIKDVLGEILLVSQFTLYGNVGRGNRPSFIDAKNPTEAIIIYEEFINELSKEIPVQTGVFGADMQVSLTNDGPVTIIIEDL